MAPEHPWTVSHTIRAEDVGDKPLLITVQEAGGETILITTLDRNPSKIEPFVEKIAASPQTSQDYLQLGLRHENFDNREQAMLAFRRSIDLSHMNGEAHLRLGLMLLRAADFTGAKSRFQSALAEGLVEANIYLGMVAFLDNHLEEARKRWLAVPDESPLRAAALLGLGAVALWEGETQAAAGWFQQATLLEDTPISPRLMLGIALARAGQAEESRKALRWVLSVDPLNHSALNEMAKLEGGESKATLERMLGDDPQYFLDLACFYLGAGLPQDALEVLETIESSWRYPTVFYLAAYLHRLLEQKEEARALLEKAGEIEPDLCFPSRLEEVKALQSAILHNPGDDKARYYLGLFYYGHQRYEDGVHLWQQSLKGLSEYDVIYRNLGIAAWQRDRELQPGD